MDSSIVVPAPDEQAAALAGRIFPRVGEDLGADSGPAAGSPASNRETASTIIAVPMPPPMHSDAAPRPPPRACSACTSVVRMRAAGANRVAERDRAAVRVDLAVEAELADHGERLRGEGLVELDEIGIARDAARRGRRPCASPAPVPCP